MENFLIFLAAGFIAELIDGALGMAYGVSLTSFLLGLGFSPAIASANVHISEIFTTGVSGLSHLKFKNIDRKLFLRLLIPGVIGGMGGAYLLTSLPGEKIKSLIAFYLLIMGLRILWKARSNSFSNREKEKKTYHKIIPLGLAGGFFDAIGGGGWGPIVTSTLVSRGNHVRFTIGSVNSCEFFVTLAESITFILSLGFFGLLKTHYLIILGLITGGLMAAPLGAFICGKVKPRILMVVVGLLIIILSIRTIILVF